MKQECKICNYETEDASNFVRHNNSTKHLLKTILFTNNKRTAKLLKTKEILAINKINKMANVEIIQEHEEKEPKTLYKCEGCNGTFKNKGSFSRHKLHRCPNLAYRKKSPSNNITKSVLIEQLKQKDAELQKKDEELKQHKDDKKYFKTLVDKAGVLAQTNATNVSKSINAITFLTQHYSNAPALEIVSEDRYLEIADKKVPLCETLIHYYREKRLDIYLGEYVVLFYKKDNPKDNSVWVTDITRSTFYIKENMDWVVDKVAQKVGAKIIDPMLDYIKENLKIFNDRENKLTKDMKQSVEEMGVHVLNNSDGVDIVRLIDKGLLKKSIIKCIAPCFQLEKAIELEEKKDENEPIELN
jgi:hypothetical protein